MMLGKIRSSVKAIQLLVLVNVLNAMVMGILPLNVLIVGWLHLLKRKVMMRMGKTLNENSSFKKDIEDEKVTYADHRKSLVIQRSLGVAYEEKENWLRKNIFHIRCISHEKVCNVIIDIGSFENVVATKIVETLKLKKKQYLHHCKLF